MFRMVNNSMKNKRLPSSLYEANICLLLKKRKEETDPASNSPVSLLNCDQKILTKVLATKLAKHISTIVHLFQVDFLLVMLICF